MVLLTYVDDCIIISLSKTSIIQLISFMQNRPENFELMDKGDGNKFLGIKMTRLNDSIFELTQPFLIDQKLSFLGLSNNDFATDHCSSSTPIAKSLLHWDLSGKPHKYSLKYRTVVGMLSYLQNTIRSAKQDDNYGASNIVLPCPGS
jgi:hypothetical protein